jgi:DNA primase
MWHCFGCNKGGDVFAFLMEIEGLEFPEAKELLAARAGVELKPYRRDPAAAGEFREYTASHSDVSKARIFEALEWATKFAEKQLWSPVGEKSLNYLRERGLTDDTIKQFRIGYIPKGWRHVADFLVSQGYAEQEIEAAGLIIRKSKENDSRTPYSVLHTSDFYDRFRERIMFPILDVLGRVIGFSARVEPGADESQAKYINTPETMVYHKSSVLYGIAWAKQVMKTEDQAIFVEGQMDVIAMHQAGFTQTLAVSGTALTEEQLKIIKRYTHSLRLFFDMDKAGQTAARRSTELALHTGMRVMIVAIEGGKDAAELAQHDPGALRGAIHSAVPALEYFLQRLTVRYNRQSPDGRRDIVEDFASLIGAMSDPIERGFWLKRLAETVESDERMVAESVERVMRSKQSPVAPQPVMVATPKALSTPSTFTHRSEILRQRIGWCCVLDTSGIATVLQKSPEPVRQYLCEDECIALLSQLSEQGMVIDQNTLITTATERGLDGVVREALFASERFLEQEGLGETVESERHEAIETLLCQYLIELEKELRREALKRIEFQMKQAREAGDKALEMQLRAEFSRLLSE